MHCIYLHMSSMWNYVSHLENICILLLKSFLAYHIPLQSLWQEFSWDIISDAGGYFVFLLVLPPGGSLVSFHFIYVFYPSIGFIWCITHPCTCSNKDFPKISYVIEATILFLTGTATRRLFCLLSLQISILLFKGFHLAYHTPLYPM